MKILLAFLIGVLTGVGLYYFLTIREQTIVINPIGKIDRPLDAYTIDNLSKSSYKPSQINLDEIIEDNSEYTSWLFSFLVNEKKVTGLANIPKSLKPADGYPVIVQFRGYVTKETYETGIGTIRSGQVYAQNGFITLAPDFLGYGGSDNPSQDIFEERFQTYIVASELINSVSTLKDADSSRIAIWGHSNGGHIALTTLEILGKTMPTVLWAPVTKPFPYSILYYTDEASDSGKYMRKKLSQFETLYNTDLYSLTNYIDRIGAPIQIHQGTADEAVPKNWTDSFVEKLKKADKQVTYYTYPGADHNLRSVTSDTWSLAVKRDVDFYLKKLNID